MSWKDDKAFEAEVLRIARAKWPQNAFSGSVVLEGRERDGIFETDDAVHFIEATTSRSQEKARNDTRKLHQAVVSKIRENPIKGARGWFVTSEEPTADQRKEVDKIGKGQVIALSFSQFQQSVVDVGGYLAARANHSFGSVKHPGKVDVDAPGASVEEISYVPINIFEKTHDRQWSISEICRGLKEGNRFVLTGQFGAGKSMTMRQIFKEMRAEYLRGNTSLFPVYINLRDHTGQNEAVEVIERHARKIGFESPASLVRAWRASFCVLLLDGFDELTSFGIQRANISKLRIIRRTALEAVRQIIKETPGKTGIIVAGRDHFFADLSETESSLGFEQGAIHLATTEFTEDQVQQFLTSRANGKPTTIPAWLPTKPLFVSYLAAHNLIDGVFDNSPFLDSAAGWDFLIDQVCERESAIDKRYLDGATIRKILARLATYARASEDGLGPLRVDDLKRAYTHVCGFEPDDQAWLILHRLPGLVIHEFEEDTRKFIDGEMVAVYRSGELIDFISDPVTSVSDADLMEAFSQATKSIGSNAIAIVSRKIDAHFDSTVLKSLLSVFPTSMDQNILCSDLVAFAVERKISIPFEVIVDGVFFQPDTFELSGEFENLNGLKFVNCYFEELEFYPDILERSPYFTNCVINRFLSDYSGNELPTKFFSGTDVSYFENKIGTNASIRNLDALMTGQKVLLTILRKLFIQSLGGRSQTALYRGLDTAEKQFVDPVLKILQQKEIAQIYNKKDGVVWLPVRNKLGYIKSLIANPLDKPGDELMISVAKLDG
ncbi:NACHT domain-containing protein [Delftia acidovorans]|uniref:NACHT domain-containing protein n=1 Tax=Delftia acidovorans TaxID=80866 RepID=UPI0018E82F58|nr:NACHT domain-containing protein [Delftia acidovorans]MBJ2142675.1 NACHT domain-containing protein [Delftia acidovorans]